MQALKYDVIKMRGIAFRGQQKVYTKGIEVGYSLATNKKILIRKASMKIELEKQKIHNALRHASGSERNSDNQIEKQVQNTIQSVTNILLKQDQGGGGGGDDSSSITDEQKRRKKQKHRH